jgi:hypothetical protein
MGNVRDAGLAIPEEKRADSRRRWRGRNWIWAAGGLLVLLVILRINVHVGYFAEDKRSATRLIEQLHERMNAGQFDLIYEDCDESLKNAKTRDEMDQSLREVASHFGAFKAVSDSEMNVIEGPAMEVRAAYNSTFEKGDATELFSFFRRGHELKLAFYQVSPGTAKLEWKHRPEAQQ